MKIPKVFLPEKDLESKVDDLIESKKVSMTKRVAGVKGFYSDTIDGALAVLLKEGYEPLFMPSIIDIRIEASKDETVWKNWYCSLSISATGKTRRGKAVVVYAHVPNYFSDPDNIKKAKRKDLINGVWIMPQDEFQKLLDLKDNKNIFVIDYKILKNSESGIIQLKDALKHPQTIPVLGGMERAEKYLDKHEEVYGEKSIGIWHYDDLYDKPVGRLLFLASPYDNDYLYGSGRFAGVRAEGALAREKSY